MDKRSQWAQRISLPFIACRTAARSKPSPVAEEERCASVQMGRGLRRAVLTALLSGTSRERSNRDSAIGHSEELLCHDAALPRKEFELDLAAPVYVLLTRAGIITMQTLSWVASPQAPE